MDNRKIIAIDFDGTIVKYVKDAYLYTDFDLMPNVQEVIAWINQRFYTVLWTCRCGEQLKIALDFLARNGLVFHSINKNAPFLDFHTSRKIFANTYIDDRGLITIDWLQIKSFLIKKYLSDVEAIIEKIIIEDK
jgi:hypothetical protein